MKQCPQSTQQNRPRDQILNQGVGHARDLNNYIIEEEKEIKQPHEVESPRQQEIEPRALNYSEEEKVQPRIDQNAAVEAAAAAAAEEIDMERARIRIEAAREADVDNAVEQVSDNSSLNDDEIDDLMADAHDSSDEQVDEK